jgi:hypothetical protein
MMFNLISFSDQSMTTNFLLYFISNCQAAEIFPATNFQLRFLDFWICQQDVTVCIH